MVLFIDLFVDYALVHQLDKLKSQFLILIAIGSR